MTSRSTTWKPKPRHTVRFARVDLSALTASFSLVFIISLFSVSIETSRHHGRSVDLPEAIHPTRESGALSPDALQIAVSRTGDFFVSGHISSPVEKIDAPSIPERLVSLELPGVERRVYVHADARAKYGDIATALAAIRYAGLSNVTFMVDRYHAASPPPAGEQP